MPPLLSAAYGMALFAVAAPSAVTALGLLGGSINTRYLLWGTRADGSRYFSAERVQLLVATVVLAAAYLGDAIHMAPTGTMPDVPSSWLMALGGSQAIYLGGKAFKMLRSPRRKR